MAPRRASLVTDRLLDAIQYAESRGQRQPTQAVGDQQNRHPAHGAYQMTKPAYQDVQRMFPEEFGSIPFETLLQSDLAFQRRAARRYLEGGESHYGITDLNRLISFYNKGPRARAGAITNSAYVNTVRQQLRLPRLEESMPKPMKPRASLPHEERIRTLNHRMVATGFRPMGIDEIEGLLTKFDEVKNPDARLPGEADYQNPAALLGKKPRNPAGSPAFGNTLMSPPVRMAPPVNPLLTT